MKYNPECLYRCSSPNTQLYTLSHGYLDFKEAWNICLNLFCHLFFKLSLCSPVLEIKGFMYQVLFQRVGSTHQSSYKPQTKLSMTLFLLSWSLRGTTLGTGFGTRALICIIHQMISEKCDWWNQVLLSGFSVKKEEYRWCETWRLNVTECPTAVRLCCYFFVVFFFFITNKYCQVVWMSQIAWENSSCSEVYSEVRRRGTRGFCMQVLLWTSVARGRAL